MPRRKPLSSLKLTIHAEVGREYVAYLRQQLKAAHAMLAPALAELSVAIVGDDRMSALHDQFMGIAMPTDVLTFPLERDGAGRDIAGEVVVCLPEARRNARARQSNVKPELLLYALHGMLHLSGFDDRTDREYRKMHRKEDEILTSLGIGPVFSANRAKNPGAQSNQPPREPSRRPPRKSALSRAQKKVGV